MSAFSVISERLTAGSHSPLEVHREDHSRHHDSVCESIRCGYHRFEFGIEGDCTKAPPLLQLAEDKRLRCKVHRFHAREAVGQYLDSLASVLSGHDVDLTVEDLHKLPIVIELARELETQLAV